VEEMSGSPQLDFKDWLNDLKERSKRDPLLVFN